MLQPSHSMLTSSCHTQYLIDVKHCIPFENEGMRAHCKAFCYHVFQGFCTWILKPLADRLLPRESGFIAVVLMRVLFMALKYTVHGTPCVQHASVLVVLLCSLFLWCLHPRNRHFRRNNVSFYFLWLFFRAAGGASRCDNFCARISGQ